MVSPTTPTTAIIGWTTQVQVEKPTSPGVYFSLIEVKDVTPPNLQVDDVEVTHYLSPGRTREYIAGFIDGGDAAVTMNRVAGFANRGFVLVAAKHRRQGSRQSHLAQCNYLDVPRPRERLRNNLAG